MGQIGQTGRGIQWRAMEPIRSWEKADGEAKKIGGPNFIPGPNRPWGTFVIKAEKN